MPNLTLGRLFMSGQSAVSKISYVGPVGGPENTSKNGGGGGNHLALFKSPSAGGLTKVGSVTF